MNRTRRRLFLLALTASASPFLGLHRVEGDREAPMQHESHSAHKSNPKKGSSFHFGAKVGGGKKKHKSKKKLPRHHGGKKTHEVRRLKNGKAIGMDLLMKVEGGWYYHPLAYIEIPTLEGVDKAVTANICIQLDEAPLEAKMLVVR